MEETFEEYEARRSIVILERLMQEAMIELLRTFDPIEAKPGCTRPAPPATEGQAEREDLSAAVTDDEKFVKGAKDRMDSYARKWLDVLRK